MSQLESMLEHSSPADLLRRDDMAASAGAASVPADAGAAFAAVVHLEIHAVRCDITPSANQLIALLNLSDRLIAARRYRDAAESGTLLLFFIRMRSACKYHSVKVANEMGYLVNQAVTLFLPCFHSLDMQICFVDLHFASLAISSRVRKCFVVPSSIWYVPSLVRPLPMVVLAIMARTATSTRGRSVCGGGRPKLNCLPPSPCTSTSISLINLWRIEMRLPCLRALVAMCRVLRL